MRILSTVLTLGMLLGGAEALAGGKVEKKDDTTWYVTVDKLPETVEECVALRDEIATEPAGGMVYYLVAQLVMLDKPEVGEKCLVISLDSGELSETIRLKKQYKRVDYKGWQLGESEVKKMKTSGFQADKAYAAKTWVLETDVKNGYELPALPYKYFVRSHNFQNLLEKGIWKGFVNTSGNATAAAPFQVKKNDKGIWKMFASSSFYVGTEDPPKKVSDDL